MNKLIKKILNKSFVQLLSKEYRFFINVNYELTLSYFFWLNTECLSYTTNGFCIKKNTKTGFHMDSFVVYLYLRNMKVNQLFFTNSPFLFFLKKKKVAKLLKRIFLL